jgi:hypothetical protein
VIVTGTVADGALEPPLPPPLPLPLPELELLLDELLLLWATGLTSVILPPTVVPSGSSTVTGS